MAGEEKRALSLPVNEADIKLILTDVERTEQVLLSYTSYFSCVLMRRVSTKKPSNADKSDTCFAFHPSIYFLNCLGHQTRVFPTMQYVRGGKYFGQVSSLLWEEGYFV